MTSPSRRRWACLSALTLGVTTVTAAQALAAPAAPQGDRPLPLDSPSVTASEKTVLAPGLDTDSTESQAVFVRLKGLGAAATAERSTARGTTLRSRVQDRRAQVESTAERSIAKVERADDGAELLYTTTNAVPGYAAMVDGSGLEALAADPDVVKVSAITTRTVANSNVDNFVRALHTWRFEGNTGKGVKIGIIDTGIDYTHATFGGPGTRAAYQEAFENGDSADWRDELPARGKVKVAGGYDFVGDDYNADPTSPTYQPIPKPDSNPLDCNGHGTHVAGSAAGYGVTPGGRTYDGDYSRLTATPLSTFKVGPGTAPEAELYGLRVFGCGGSTNATIAALDWALDPNGDGDFSDSLDIVNLSLGSAFSPTDDPENAVVDELARHGVLSVISNGNEGDLTDAGGSPGSATSALTVASSVDAQQQFDAVRVDAPSNVAGNAAGQFSVEYDWFASDPVSGSVVTLPSNADGCRAFSADEAARVAGKIVWLEWDDDDTTRACGSVARGANAADAGAIGAIFTTELDIFGAGIAGVAEIPIIQLTAAATDRLRPAADAGTLRITFDGDLAGSAIERDPSIADRISSFTSRGGHGSFSVVKPDLAAPGDTISSAAVGGGTEAMSMSGTSMAAPVAAGVAALVKAGHDGWTPTEIKTAMMNTAGNDLFTANDRKGNRYAPARVGAGRIDARSAVTTTALAWSPGENGPVSASFGVVEAPIDGGRVTQTKRISVKNLNPRSAIFDLSYDGINAQPGVRYSLSPTNLRIPGNQTRTATLTMTVDPAAIRRTRDRTMDADQIGAPRQFVPDASGRVLITETGKAPLRVPVYASAKPSSSTTASYADGRITLEGAGLNQGSGVQRHRSMVSVLEHGASSGQLPVCLPGQTVACLDQESDGGLDIQHVGAGADDDYLWFGISTWGDWATVGRASVPFVDYDLDGDGEYDAETYLQFFADTDVLYAVTVDLATGATLDLQPVNFFDADVDTNVFDNNVVMLPVSKEALGLSGAGSQPITYAVGMADAVSGSTADFTDDIEFDAGAPAIATGGPVYLDRNGTAIDLTGTGGAKALVLHLHGTSGERAQVIDVPGQPQ